MAGLLGACSGAAELKRRVPAAAATPCVSAQLVTEEQLANRGLVEQRTQAHGVQYVFRARSGARALACAARTTARSRGRFELEFECAVAHLRSSVRSRATRPVGERHGRRSHGVSRAAAHFERSANRRRVERGARRVRSSVRGDLGARAARARGRDRRASSAARARRRGAHDSTRRGLLRRGARPANRSSISTCCFGPIALRKHMPRSSPIAA